MIKIAAKNKQEEKILNYYLKKILDSRVYEVAQETNLEKANNLSFRLDKNIYLKREDTQPTFSFKIRG